MILNSPTYPEELGKYFSKEEPINMQDVWKKDIEDLFDAAHSELQHGLREQIKANLPPPTPVSPYHNIRLALTGKTAPFINMPLGQTRVYVERVK